MLIHLIMKSIVSSHQRAELGGKPGWETTCPIENFSIVSCICKRKFRETYGRKINRCKHLMGVNLLK